MPGNVVLETRELTMEFGGVVAVNHVGFRLYENELRCLIGPNGAGKSTFFKCLTGMLAPTSGGIWLWDTPVVGLHPHQIARLGVGIKTQVPSVMYGLSARENVWLAARRHHGARAAGRIADDTLARVDVADLARQPVSNLAHGQRQLVELAVVLASEPWLVLLDEPAAGMTHDEVDHVIDLIQEINRKATIIIVEHDMQFVRRIADVVTVFHQGRILIEGKVDQVLQDAQVRDIYLGKRA